MVLAVSTSSVEGESGLRRVIDAVLVLMLGYVHTFNLLTLHDAGDPFQPIAPAIRPSAADRRGEHLLSPDDGVHRALHGDRLLLQPLRGAGRPPAERGRSMRSIATAGGAPYDARRSGRNQVVTLE